MVINGNCSDRDVRNALEKLKQQMGSTHGKTETQDAVFGEGIGDIKQNGWGDVSRRDTEGR